MPFALPIVLVPPRQSSLELHWESMTPMDRAGIVSLRDLQYADEVIQVGTRAGLDCRLLDWSLTAVPRQAYPAQRHANQKCEYAVSGQELVRLVERGRNALSATTSAGEEAFWPEWPRLHQLLQQVKFLGGFSLTKIRIRLHICSASI